MINTAEVIIYTKSNLQISMASDGTDAFASHHVIVIMKDDPLSTALSLEFF